MVCASDFDFLYKKARKGPKITEQELNEFETKNGIVLPEQARFFVLNVANSLTRVRDGYEHSLEVVHFNRKGKPSRDTNLCQEFLFDEPYDPEKNGSRYNNYSDCKSRWEEDDENEEIWSKCQHCYECVDSIGYDDFGWDDPKEHGSLVLLDAGCGYLYRLVLNGKHKGEVWYFADGGFSLAVPMCEDFISFLKMFTEAECL